VKLIDFSEINIYNENILIIPRIVWRSSCEKYSGYIVTHWRPIPTPPKPFEDRE